MLQFLTFNLHRKLSNNFLLDDLHRADTDSLQILTTILRTKSSFKNLVFIGTYHSDKVNDDHPLSNVMKAISENNLSVSTIELYNLSSESVNNMISDTLRQSQMSTVPLSALIVTKTSGHPFSIREFLRSLLQKRLLFFCNDDKCWKWTIEEHVTNEVSSNEMHLIADKLQQYDALTQTFLVHASCVGSEFSLKTLELIGHFPKDISRMIDDGFLSPTEGSGDSFKFTHEHVKQAIFSLDPTENKKIVYFCIGHSL